MTAARRQRATTQTSLKSAQPKLTAKQPLSDASNCGARAAPAPPNKLRGGFAADTTPQAPTASPAAEAAILDHLPGFDDDGPPAPASGGRLPLESGAESQAFFGNVFAKGGEAGAALRVTSVTRSASARKLSNVRLVAQPDAAEGRRMSQLAPQERPSLRARTIPIRARKLSPANSSSSRGSLTGVSTAGEAFVEGGAGAGVEACASAPQPEQPHSPTSSSSSAQPEALSSGCPTPQQPSSASPADAAADSDAESASGCTTSADTAASVPYPVALPVQQWQAAVAVASDQRQQAQQNMVATAPPSQGMGQAGSAPSLPGSCSSAGPVGEAAGRGAGPAQAGAPPADLGGLAATQPQAALPAPLLSLSSQTAAAAWRSQWLRGLQAHNAARSGQPIRAGSRWQFIPLDPNDPLLSVLMFHTAVMPAQVTAGAARFQDIILSSADLGAEAAAAGVLSYGVWGVAAPDGSYHLLAEGKQIALPISFRRAPPRLVTLFLACVWHEANRAEAAQHMTFTFTASGERLADESCLKYSPGELLEWVAHALGCEQAAHESVAALAHIAQFGEA